MQKTELILLKIQHHTQEAPIHWAALADEPEKATVSPKYCGIQLKSKEHQVQTKLKDKALENLFIQQQGRDSTVELRRPVMGTSGGVLLLQFSPQ